MLLSFTHCQQQFKEKLGCTDFHSLGYLNILFLVRNPNFLWLNTLKCNAAMFYMMSEYEQNFFK